MIRKRGNFYRRSMRWQNRGTHLAAWAKEIVEKKISTVNMLGCHDGIPLLDLKGLLPKEEIERQF